MLLATTGPTPRAAAGATPAGGRVDAERPHAAPPLASSATPTAETINAERSGTRTKGRIYTADGALPALYMPPNASGS
jgi:hypothetical protein